MNTRMVVKHRRDGIVLSLCIDTENDRVSNVSFAIAEWSNGTPICPFRMEEWGFVADYNGQYKTQVDEALESLKEEFAKTYNVEWAEVPSFISNIKEDEKYI